MEEVQYAIITGLGKSERTDDAGDAQQIDSHRHSGNTGDKPQEGSHSGQAERRARAAFSQWVQSFMPVSRKGVDK